ncbi:uncharacterized protein LOC123876887 [Maniola jurtina]|uniref:uncharacterized protein LOC123876887 n=1 Tax=Maniola jurtina TaxID=191418 RepID=UPI001E68E28C|nr:uncharacterized protein LOC123876887 [Maniola jurtina]
MNSVVVYYCLFFAYYYSVGKTLPLNGESATAKTEKRSMKLRNELQIQSTTVNNIILGTHNVDVLAKSNNRVKRQSGAAAAKWVEVAQMPLIKLVRLFLQVFKNTWDNVVHRWLLSFTS